MVLILLQIGQGNLKDSSLQRIICVFQACCPIDEGFSDTNFQRLEDCTVINMIVSSYSLIWNEDGAWSFVSYRNDDQIQHKPYLDLIPILPGEGILSLLLETLFALRKAFVPAHKSETTSSDVHATQ
jgi:hypothetical protein